MLSKFEFGMMQPTTLYLNGPHQGRQYAVPQGKPRCCQQPEVHWRSLAASCCPDASPPTAVQAGMAHCCCSMPHLCHLHPSLLLLSPAAAVQVAKHKQDHSTASSRHDGSRLLLIVTTATYIG